MTCPDGSDPEQLLHFAQLGERDSLGRLLEMYRSYLVLLARLGIDHRLQGKADASDLVQETFLQAYSAFSDFRGSSEAELLCWLRRILSSKLAKLVRRFYAAQRRDVRLEQNLDEELDRSSQMVQALIWPGSSPSQRTVRREQAVLLADALQKLPADNREVIILHHLQELPLREVALRMGRSEDGVERLWVRSLAVLQRALKGEFDDRT